MKATSALIMIMTLASPLSAIAATANAKCVNFSEEAVRAVVSAEKDLESLERQCSEDGVRCEERDDARKHVGFAKTFQRLASDCVSGKKTVEDAQRIIKSQRELRMKEADFAARVMPGTPEQKERAQSFAHRRLGIVHMLWASLR